MKKKQAFTLAEVLITLGIIGVIAAITIPAIVTSTKEQTAITQLKKTYSALQQAFILAQEKYGEIANWGISMEENGGGEQVLLNYFSPFMQHIKICKNGYGCFPNVTYKNIDGTNYVNWNILNDRSAMILNDGTMVMFNTSAAKDYSKYGQIYVDVNGSKPPNQVGIDFFYFYLFDNAIVPSGAPRYYGNEFFKEKCINKAGFACAAWVIYNENMDYLHCTDLGWNGRKRCPKK